MVRRDRGRLTALAQVAAGALLLAACASAEPAPDLQPGPDDAPAQAIAAWVDAYSSQRCEEFETLIHYDATSGGGGPGSYVRTCEKQSLGELSPTGMVIGGTREEVTPPPEGTSKELRVPVQFVIEGEPQVGDFYVVQISGQWLVYDNPDA